MIIIKTYRISEVTVHDDYCVQTASYAGDSQSKIIVIWKNY